jgi:hypothetical protein
MRLGLDGLPIAEQRNEYKLHRVKPAKPDKEHKVSTTQAARADALTKQGRTVKQGSLGNTVFRWPRDY